MEHVQRLLSGTRSVAQLFDAEIFIDSSACLLDTTCMGLQFAGYMTTSASCILLQGSEAPKGHKTTATVRKTEISHYRRSTTPCSYCSWCGKIVRSRKLVRNIIRAPEIPLKSPIGQIVVVGSVLCQPTCYLAWMNLTGQLKYANLCSNFLKMMRSVRMLLKLTRPVFVVRRRKASSQMNLKSKSSFTKINTPVQVDIGNENVLEGSEDLLSSSKRRSTLKQLLEAAEVPLDSDWNIQLYIIIQTCSISEIAPARLRSEISSVEWRSSFPRWIAFYTFIHHMKLDCEQHCIILNNILGERRLVNSPFVCWFLLVVIICTENLQLGLSKHTSFQRNNSTSNPSTSPRGKEDT